jgi:ribosome biogenesis GTPase
VRAAEDLARHRAAGKRRREGSVRYKSGAGGRRTREALLNPKSHRRVSRRQVRWALATPPEP